MFRDDLRPNFLAWQDFESRSTGDGLEEVCIDEEGIARIAANMVRTRAGSVCKSFRHLCHAHQIESLGTISYLISTILRNSFRFLIYHQRIFPKFDAMRENVAWPPN